MLNDKRDLAKGKMKKKKQIKGKKITRREFLRTALYSAGGIILSGLVDSKALAQIIETGLDIQTTLTLIDDGIGIIIITIIGSLLGVT